MATKETKKTIVKKKKNAVTVTSHGTVYITSTFNNTVVTVTNDKGETITWSSSGARGFKGTRRSTPYAASLAMEDAAKRALERGLKTVDVYVKGPGAGRD